MTSRWNAFFHAPGAPTVAAVFRIGYAFLLLVNVLCWLPDLGLWFGEGGLFPWAAAREAHGQFTFTLLPLISGSPALLGICMAFFIAQIVALLVGWRTRIQAVCVFVWFLSFYNRSVFIWDGEDKVFLVLGFLLMFLPCGDRLSLDARKGMEPAPSSLWPLRLIQVEMCLIFLASGLEKLRGVEWRQGNAMYYVGQLHDSMRGIVPQALFTWMPSVRAMTWSVMAVELAVPFLIWVPRLRRYALGAAILLHLGIEATMNLFLFQWIMIVGWLAFVDEGWLASRLRRKA